MNQPRQPTTAGLELDVYQRALAEIERAREKQVASPTEPELQELTQPMRETSAVTPVDTPDAETVLPEVPTSIGIQTVPASAERATIMTPAELIRASDQPSNTPPVIPQMRAAAPKAPTRPANARPLFISPAAKPTKSKADLAPRRPLLTSAPDQQEAIPTASTVSASITREAEPLDRLQEGNGGSTLPTAGYIARPGQDRVENQIHQDMPALISDAQEIPLDPAVPTQPPAALSSETRSVEELPISMSAAVVDDGRESRLSQLDFSDLYIESCGRVWYKRAPTDMYAADVEGQALADALLLREACTQQAASADFYLTFQDVPLRVDHVRTRTGTVFVCRRLNSKPRPIDELGYPKKLIEALLSPKIHAGMILLAGSAGAGKTTTLASIGASRLARFGGTAFTIENPFELGLEGTYHGADGVVGTCYQTQVSSDDEFGSAIKQRLRSGPNMLFIGEIRSAEAAAEAAIAGASGHLVGATIHGSNPIATLERYRALLTAAGQDVSLLAESLAVLIHQSMRVVRDGELTTRRVDPNPLVITGHENEDAIRANLRKGDFAMLVSEVDRQRRLLVNNGAR